MESHNLKWVGVGYFEIQDACETYSVLSHPMKMVARLSIVNGHSSDADQGIVDIWPGPEIGRLKLVTGEKMDLLSRRHYWYSFIWMG